MRLMVHSLFLWKQRSLYLGLEMRDSIKLLSSFHCRSPKFVNNPHIRARLAQLLSLMIPREDDDGRGLVPGVSHKLKMSAVFTCNYK